jgi:5-hydroxyisourate hydrolase-like protein (transthyretin family)
MYKKEGNITKYLNLVANGQTNFFHLEQDDGTIIGQYKLKVYITKYYKNMFGAPAPNHFFSLIETERNDIPQLSDQE